MKIKFSHILSAVNALKNPRNGDAIRVIGYPDNYKPNVRMSHHNEKIEQVILVTCTVSKDDDEYIITIPEN